MKKILLMLVMLLGCYSVSFAETYEVTAYTHTGSVMANGEYPHVGAVASNDFPLGTVLSINGSRYVVKNINDPVISHSIFYYITTPVDT